MYSFPYLEPVCCSMSSSNGCFLTCIQISQEAGQVVWYSHLFQFPEFVVVHCQEPAWEIPPMTRSCRTRGTPWAIPPMTRSCGRVLISKASGLDGPPGPARESTLEPESVCLTILCLSPALLTLAGGYPQPPLFWGKST